MHYVQFKPQTVLNAKCIYHCSGPLESYLYTQTRPGLANFLILMFLSHIKRTQHAEYNKLDGGKPHLGKS